MSASLFHCLRSLIRGTAESCHNDHHRNTINFAGCCREKDSYCVVLGRVLSRELLSREVFLVKKACSTLSLPESVKETFMVVLTCQSVDEILWCDHSNETSSAVLSHGTICF